MPPSRWEKGRERVVATTPVLELKAVAYRHPARNADREFTVVAAPDWVNVVAVTPGGDIVLVRQFRYGTDDFSLEIPGGVIEAGEDPVAAGVRELAEETGYVGRRARLIGSVRPNPAIQSNRCHLVLVEEAVAGGATEWDRDEEMDVLTATLEQALEWARSGAITHALVVCGLFHYEQLKRREN